MKLYSLIKHLIIFIFIISLVTVAGYNIFCYCYNIVLSENGYGQLHSNYNTFFDRYNATNDAIKSFNDSMHISSEDSDWLVSDYKDGICINKYLGFESDVVVPETLDGKKVLMIGCNFIAQNSDSVYSSMDYLLYYHTAFDNSNIESITIPATVEEITVYTFRDISDSERPTLKNINVDKDNLWFEADGGEIRIKNSESLIYSYRYERIRYVIDNLPLPLLW